jgi:NAD dependent epimerase/dehydratase family enzyme
MLVELGTRFMKTESELVLKSRRVIPTVLHNHGFEFEFPEWVAAASNLAKQLH